MSSYAFVINGTEHDLLTYYGIRVTGTTGMGMPPADNITTPYAIGDGSYYQRTVYRQRTIQLACAYGTGTQAQYHSNLKKLIADINRDTLNNGVFQLKYYGANASVPAVIDVRYSGGLEGAFDYASVFNPFVISLLAVTPYWKGGTLQSVTMNYSASLTGASYLAQYDGSAWNALAASGRPAAQPNALLTDASGNLWVASGAKVYKYSGGAWSSWTVAGGSAVVYALTKDAAGNIYAAGNFTSINSVSDINGIAKWNGSTWSSYSPFGFPGTATYYALCYANGILWAGGNLALNAIVYTKDGVAPCQLLSYTSGIVYCLTAHGNYIYFGGTISGTDSFSATITKAGKIYYNDPTAAATPIVYALGTPNNTVRAVVVDPSGYPVFGGDFTDWDGTTLGYIYRYGGDNSTFAGGLNNSIYGLAYSSTGDSLYAVGAFTNAAGAYYSKYISGAWVNGGIVPAAAGTAINIYGAIITIGYNSSTVPITPGVTAIDNTGDRSAYPIITIARSGGTTTAISYLTNTYTSDTLLFSGSGYALQDGETVTITLTPGAQAITSSVNGNILGQLVPGSNLSTWCVSPGNHSYTMLIVTTGSPTITATLAYYTSYWSADGVAA